MSITPRFLDELRSRVTLSEIIGRRVRVTRAGREFKACCPFHKEKSPSFTINDDKQFYHCFGCGAHGDAIGFVMQHDNLSFIDAVEMLCADAGMQMPAPDPMAVERAEKDRSLYGLMDAATEWMRQQLFLPANKDVLSYLYQRGFDDETLAAFRVGYALQDRQAMRVHLKGQGYTDAEMLDAGVLKKSQKNGEFYVFFRDRVMFPVADRRGRVIAFGGRALPDHMRPPAQDGFTPPKYLNSSDTTLFDKSRTLYGEAPARQAAREGKTVLVTEGYMDVIACHKAGFTGAVAPMGTALTDEQIQMLWSMIPSDNKVPILCFDGDNAGRKAAARACENVLSLLKPGCSVRFAFMPDGEDPDSLIKGGGSQALQKVLERSIPLIDFIWMLHTAGQALETPEERAGVSQSLRNQVAKIADAEVQAHYKALINERISETFFARKDFRNNRNGSGAGGYKPNRPRGVKPRAPMFNDLYGRILCAAILNHPQAFEAVEEPFARFPIQMQGLESLRQEVLAVLMDDPDVDRGSLHLTLRERGFEKEMDDILNKSVYGHAAFSAPDYSDEDVAEKWLELWRALQEKALGREVKVGWQQALHHESAEDEEKLRRIMKGSASE